MRCGHLRRHRAKIFNIYERPEINLFWYEVSRANGASFPDHQ
jgi:hypothetical protein